MNASTAILDDRRAASFEAALAPALSAGFESTEPELKRVPSGFAPDQPELRGCGIKSHTVYTRHALTPWLHTPERDLVVGTELAATRSAVDWLGNAVGPRAHERGR